MTRLSRNSSHPERSFSPPKVLHSTSGNAHFSGTESLSSSGQADSNPLTASLYHPHPTSSHGPYVPFEVRDRRGHLHCGWKKITSINGCTSRQHQTTTEADEYLDRQIIEDAQGRKHAIWVRIDGMLTHAEIYSPKYIAYRARQQKVVDKNGEQVWSDELEEAFQFGRFQPSQYTAQSLLIPLKHYGKSLRWARIRLLAARRMGKNPMAGTS